MTALNSRLIIVGERLMIRVRAVTGPSGEPIAELTQLHHRPDGLEAERARVLLDFDRMGELTSALQAVRAEVLNAAEQAAGRNRLSPVKAKPPFSFKRYRAQEEF